MGLPVVTVVRNRRNAAKTAKDGIADERRRKRKNVATAFYNKIHVDDVAVRLWVAMQALAMPARPVLTVKINEQNLNQLPTNCKTACLR